MYDEYMYDNERVTYPEVGKIILYHVNHGDNVYRLAKTFQSDVDWIKVMNKLDDEARIFPHQQLLIPMLFQKAQPMPYQRESYDLYF